MKPDIFFYQLNIEQNVDEPILLELKQKIFFSNYQIARYNLKLKANYLIVTNGIEHFYCKMDFENETYIFLKDIQDYKQSCHF